jgi:hypothetical protein
MHTDAVEVPTGRCIVCGQPDPALKHPDPRPACPICGAVGTLRPVEKRLWVWRRARFGLMWLLATVFTVGLAALVWPFCLRRQTVGVDRWVECTACGSRF